VADRVTAKARKGKNRRDSISTSLSSSSLSAFEISQREVTSERGPRPNSVVHHHAWSHGALPVGFCAELFGRPWTRAVV
jgi:hypothetical protein